ncbi:MAG: type II secretion system minor pseudopilin GspH [Gammaproteobacteria bacterium]|nr:type II secretion system minor pseudopilin GspH [Gammaproteobacteria bacterium]
MTRTSPTPTCSRLRAVGPRRCRAGFTLLEILLVVTIIGILASVVVLGATDIGRQRTVRAEAERLALAVELARDEARVRNEVWGLLVDRGSYRFQRYDQARDQWHDIERREFGTDATERGIEFVVGSASSRLDAVASDFPWEARVRAKGGNSTVAAGSAPTDRPPDVVIYPGGDLTPFEVSVTGGEAFATWVAQSDGIQRTRAIAETDVGETTADFDQWLLDTGLIQ